MYSSTIVPCTENFYESGIRAFEQEQAALRQALSEAYGIDGEDVDGLIEAVKNGKVKDDAY